MELKSLLAELDDDTRSNLYQFVDRELNNEYMPKHKNKAAKLSPDALLNCSVSGERMRAEVREGGKAYRLDMTFPLFDLHADYTLVVCSCQRDALSLDAQRCAHMYFFQSQVRNALTALKEAVTTDPLVGLKAILEGDEMDEDRWLKDVRFKWVFDPIRWALHFEKQTKSKYDPDAEWQWEKNFTLEDWLKLEGRKLPSNAPAEQLFDLLEEAFEEGASITDGHRLIALEPGNVTFEMHEDEAGLTIKPALGPSSLQVNGRGFIVWHERTANLTLVKLAPREEHFIQYLLRMDRPFPIAHRERVLDLLGRMDQAMFRLAPHEEGPLLAITYQPIARLTPFKKGGMKVEIKLQIEPGLTVFPGQGGETITKLDGKGSWERDISRELRLAEGLAERLRLEQLPQPEPGVWIAYNDGKALEVVAAIEGEKGKADFLVEWPSFLAKKAYDMAAPLAANNLKVSVGEKKDWLAVEGWLELDDGHKLSLKEILKTLKRRNNYLQLPDGRWSLIPEHFKDKMQGLADSVDFDEEGEMSLDLAALDDEGKIEALEAFPFQESSKKFWSLVARAKRSRSMELPVPDALTVEMRPYQVEGYRWLARLGEWGLGACLADDMGLGKTVQTLAVLLARASKGPSLVIAPSSLSYNWQAEASRFAPTLKIVQMRELGDRGATRSFQPGEVVIASYGMIQRYAENLAATRWNTMVLDEAQTIKNAQTKTAQAVQTLEADWRVALSGTPIENHLGDLWSMFRTISPGLFGEWEKFRRSFVFPIEREDSASAKERLKHKIAPFVLRRMKRDYLSELPEKTEVDLWIDLSADEQAVYDAIRGEAIEKVESILEENAEAQTQMHILAALTKLRQAACHRGLVDESWEGGSSKVQELKNRLFELKEAGHAALVFSQFTRLLKMIQTELTAEGFKILYLDGQTPAKERQRLVDLFQRGDYDLFLISLKAGGTGLNLTRASYVFHLDPWWNPAIENQASDRAYRMGQKNAVTVYRLRSRGTIEELIHAMHGEKRALVEAVLAGKASGERINWQELWQALWPNAGRNKSNEARESPGSKPSPLKKLSPSREESLF